MPNLVLLSIMCSVISLSDPTKICTQDWCSRSMVSAQVVGNQMVPPCEEWWFEMATKQHLNYYPSISPCSGYTAWMPDERFQENHNSFPLENWRRPMGRPCITWMKTIQHYLKSNLHEWSNQCGSERRPLHRVRENAQYITQSNDTYKA